MSRKISDRLRSFCAIAAVALPAMLGGCGDDAVEPAPPLSGGRSILTGTVLGGNGKPIVGATVESEPASMRAVTDTGGRFVLRGLGQKNYTVRVTKEEATTSVSYAISKDSVDVTILLPRWKLLWQDEFDGTAQKSENWENSYGPDGVEGSDIYYDTNRISVADGRMRLEIIRQPTPTPYHGIKNHRGAAMHSRQTWQHGRFAVRARIPRGQGLWPAIWLWPISSYRRPEFDIMENLGHDPSLIYMTYHFDSAGVLARHIKAVRGPDYSLDYHEYAFEWFANECRWYIDGVEKFRSPIIGDIRPLHLILNTGVGGSWGGYPDSTTVLPQYFDIDYVRVYEATE